MVPAPAFKQVHKPQRKLFRWEPASEPLRSYRPTNCTSKPLRSYRHANYTAVYPKYWTWPMCQPWSRLLYLKVLQPSKRYLYMGWNRRK